MTHAKDPINVRIGDLFLLIYRPAQPPPKIINRNVVGDAHLGWAVRCGSWAISFGRHL